MHYGVPLTQNKLYYNIVELAVARLLSVHKETCCEKRYSPQSFYATHGSLRPLPISRKHGKSQNSITKIYFSNRHS